MALFILWIFANQVIKTFYYDEKAKDLEARAVLIANVIDPALVDEQGYLNKLCRSLGEQTKTRVTVVRMDGMVVGDSHDAPEAMDNHNDRPEIIDAINLKVGTSQRYSYTLEKEMLYLAIPYEKKSQRLVIRTSLPISSLEEALSELRFSILLGGLFVLVFGAIVSYVISRKIVNPIVKLKQEAKSIADGNFNKKIYIAGTKEFIGLADALNIMAEQLEERIKTITNQTNEQVAILSSMIEGIIAIDNEEHIMRINTAAEKLFGIVEQDAIGKPLNEVIRNSVLLEYITEIIATRQEIQREIIVTQVGDRNIRVHNVEIIDGENQPIGVLLVFSDVTQIKKLERINQDFVANVSHELKTPITAVKGFVETLQNVKIKDKKAIRKYLNVIGHHTDRMNAIITDLLELSRLEQEEQILTKQLHNEKLLPVLEAAIQECQFQAEKKSIKVNLSCPRSLAVPLEIGLLSYAVRNLIENAIQYSESKANIYVDAIKDDEYVKISVKDEGIGIETKHFSRLFERFYRIDKGRSRKHGGTGLGLAIVKHIIKIHNGQIAVESQLGIGSTFTISLPI